MKKLIIIFLTVIVAASCSELTDLNQDVKNPETVPSEALFANAVKDLFDRMTSTNVNNNNFRLWSQQWAQTTYADESNYELVERNVNGRQWNLMYAEVIRDLREFKAAVEEDELLSDEQKKNRVAMAEVLIIYTYHVMVDVFGNIPYNEAMGDDVTPAYDDDASIYADLAVRINNAIVSLSGDSKMGDSDLVYGGDIAMWKKFANSLKLRFAIRLADQAMAESAAAGAFTSNADNFALAYQSSTPNTNPLWVDLIQSGRSDFIAASTIVDPMNTMNDPRINHYFQDPVDGAIKGGVYGDNNNYNAFSHPGTMQTDPTFPGIIMSYWEVEFLLADAASRGWSVGGTAESHYNAGITASILYWGATQAEADAYLLEPGVAWATATGTDQQKIAMQKWISLYDQGFEAWSSYRLYNYPVLPIAAQAQIPTPRRFTYPVTEYSLNEENVESAGSAIGGDKLDSKVFWDVN